MFGRVDALRTLLADPQIYKPAGRAMAKLTMTDPALLTADINELPPAWTPPDLGRVGPLEIGIGRNQMLMSTTSGLAEFNGYVVDRTPGTADEIVDHFTLSTRGLDGTDQDRVVEQFVLPKGLGYTEEELVRDALTELDRRKAARATKTDPAVTYQVSDPDVDRRRLLYEHPAIAQKLGLPIPSASTTHWAQIP